MGLLRARRPERQEQLDQVQHVHAATEVEVGRAALGVARRPKGEQQLDQVQHVDGVVGVKRALVAAVVVTVVATVVVTVVIIVVAAV